MKQARNFRIDEKVYRELKACAALNGLTIGGQIGLLLEQANSRLNTRTRREEDRGCRCLKKSADLEINAVHQRKKKKLTGKSRADETSRRYLMDDVLDLAENIQAVDLSTVIQPVDLLTVNTRLKQIDKLDEPQT